MITTYTMIINDSHHQWSMLVLIVSYLPWWITSWARGWLKHPQPDHQLLIALLRKWQPELPGFHSRFLNETTLYPSFLLEWRVGSSSWASIFWGIITNNSSENSRLNDGPPGVQGTHSRMSWLEADHSFRVSTLHFLMTLTLFLSSGKHVSGLVVRAARVVLINA